ncbi:MAG: methyltransferase domain-containing protein [Planctomycetes bacterium]|jgi:hypothetical protein|nr:methyltransferase domain-containing protein [Planctomycetota bacterium]
MNERGGILDRLWSWPDGLAWRTALAAGGRQRRQRFKAVIRRLSPGPTCRVLDIGVEADGGPTSNAFERWYPWPQRLVAAGVEGEPAICRRRGITYVRADGCNLPFDDGQFDIVHGNAVIEHVGSGERQRRLVAEACRVGRAVWIATPNAACPIETHTLIPLAHWLPARLRNVVYRAAARGYFATQEHLNLLDAAGLRDCFPADVRPGVAVYTQYLLGLPMTLVAVADRR